MASAINKNTCAKCNKGAGTAMCYGCEQAFCTKHFIEHRQELSQQMDNIGQEHDILRRDLTTEQSTHHPLLERIDQWEKESIIKIQTTAELARTDLQQILDREKNNLKTSVKKTTEELQSSRESDDYTELDIKKWINQLQGFRKVLDNPTTINIDYENGIGSVIHLIKVINQQSFNSFHQVSQLHKPSNETSHNLETSPDERFVDVFGNIELSENGLVATRIDSYQDIPSVGSIGRYSSGVHYVRLRIEQLSRRCFAFFGIVNSSKKITEDILNSPSRYGWWDLDYNVISGSRKRHNLNKTIQTGDEVTLMLDCDNRRIQLEHHRTKRTVDMSIDIQKCAFPWKIIVLLLAKNDCVRILP